MTNYPSLLYSASQVGSTPFIPRSDGLSGAVTLQAHLATAATIFVCTLIAALLRWLWIYINVCIFLFWPVLLWYLIIFICTTTLCTLVHVLFIIQQECILPLLQSVYNPWCTALYAWDSDWDNHLQCTMALEWNWTLDLLKWHSCVYSMHAWEVVVVLQPCMYPSLRVWSKTTLVWL